MSRIFLKLVVNKLNRGAFQNNILKITSTNKDYALEKCV